MRTAVWAVTCATELSGPPAPLWEDAGWVRARSCLAAPVCREVFSQGGGGGGEGWVIPASPPGLVCPKSSPPHPLPASSPAKKQKK